MAVCLSFPLSAWSGGIGFKKGRGGVNSFFWPASEIIASDVGGTGTCNDPVAAVINSGPELQTVICTDDDLSVFEGFTRMPKGWNGQPLTFDLSYVQTADDQAGFSANVSAQCCESRVGLVDNGFGAEVDLDDGSVTGLNRIDTITSGPVTASGTCSGGDYLFWQIEVDADDTTTAMATLNIIGVEMKYKTFGDNHEVIATNVGTDFSADANCMGAWIIFDDGTQAEAQLDRCNTAAQNGADDMTWAGGAGWVAGAAPVGTPTGYDSATMAGGANAFYSLADADAGIGVFEAPEFTAACWFYRDGAAADEVVMSKNDLLNWEILAMGPEESVRGEILNSPEIGDANAIPAAEWHHIALRSVTATDTVEVFADGVETCAGACQAQVGPPGGSNDPLRIGAEESGAGRHTGRSMECVYFNRFLTDAELGELFLCGLDGTADGTARDFAYGGATCDDINDACCN